MEFNFEQSICNYCQPEIDRKVREEIKKDVITTLEFWKQYYEKSRKYFQLCLTIGNVYDGQSICKEHLKEALAELEKKRKHLDECR